MRFDPSFLVPTPHPQILARVLANLAGTYARTGDPNRRLRALELRSDIPGVGSTPRSLAELAEAYVAVGRTGEAVEVFEGLVERLDPRRRQAVVERLAVLRAGWN